MLIKRNGDTYKATIRNAVAADGDGFICFQELCFWKQHPERRLFKWGLTPAIVMNLGAAKLIAEVEHGENPEAPEFLVKTAEHALDAELALLAELKRLKNNESVQYHYFSRC